MDVVFGLWADGGACPDHGGGEHGALGQPVVGPRGLIDIIETVLGNGGPPSAQVVRIARLQAYLAGLDGEFFWSKSFALDPWSSARTLLSWRDELVGLGWRDDATWTSPRLADLATLSQAARDLPDSLSDRIVGILHSLEAATRPPIARVRLIDQREVCPKPLRRLLSRLEQIGCQIEEIALTPAAPSTRSLGQLQRWMQGAADDLTRTEDSVTVATAASATLAAETVGQWIAGQDADGFALIAQGGDTDLLDHGLVASGQPRAGRSAQSVHRGSLQLLLLAFTSAWAPFDARAMMELLVLPNPPIARRAAWRLAAALEQAPGRGGEAWRDAWDAIEAQENIRAAEDSDALKKIAPRLAWWRRWAEPKLADPTAGMPLEQALELCDAVAQWAGQRYALADDMLAAATATLANEVRAALAALGRERLPRLLVERIIEQALDDGQPNPMALTEAAGWRAVTHPGAVWAPTPAVVWWNFSATSDGTGRSPWSESERAELAAAGCAADPIDLPARAVSAAWERAVMHARDHLLLISAGSDCASDEASHPLAHRLKPALDTLATRIALETALARPEIELAGQSLPRLAIAPSAMPAARLQWPTPPKFAERLVDHQDSATSLEALLSCQLMWALRHVANLRPGRVRAIPDGNQLLGNLAHALARTIFTPGPPPDPAAAETTATELLDAHIDELAAPLRQPELAEELNLARRRLPRAMASLARCLRDNGLLVEATEQQVSGTFETLLALRGAVDLVARDPAGNAVIVDLKWTRSDKSRVDELESGRAVQLATYGALVAGDAPYRAGYFLLNQQQFATLAGEGLIGREVAARRGFGETWAAILSSWQSWRTAADNGQLLATGVPGAADLAPLDIALVREVRCEWCDYATLCRVRGLS